MAKVIGSLQDFDKLETETWAEHDARTTKVMEEMQVQSDNLPEGEVVGGIISFPVADGRAIYQVVKAKPLHLAHVPFSDAWHASDITIRGLNVEDVKLMLKRSKAMPRLKPMLHIPSPHAVIEALAAKKAEEVKAAPIEIDVDKRFKYAVENADCAFWASIAESYPEIKSGDLGPDVVIPFTIMTEKAVAAWLTGNAPEGMDAADLVHSDLLTGSEGNNGVLEVIKPTRSSEFPSRSEVARIKETYPVGTRIRLEYMPADDPAPIPYGTQGVVQDIDDVGQLMMKWDNGRTLSVIPGVDKFGVVKVSFENFVATRKWSEDIGAAIGDASMEANNGNGKIKGYIYRECLYIQQEDNGSYYLPIERDEYRSPKLEELEKTLYDMHFALIGY
jgi:hypothetical protein